MSPRHLLILCVILISTTLATNIDPALNKQHRGSGLRLLATINSTTSLTQSPTEYTTIFYQNTESKQQKPLHPLLDDLLHDPIYQTVAVLVITQSIVLCCLIYYCRKQSVSNKQIKVLSHKIDALIYDRYKQSVSSPQSVSVNTAPIRSSTVSSQNEVNHRYTPVQSTTFKFTSPQKVSQSDNDTESSNNRISLRPWTPKTPNGTSLPPPPKDNNMVYNNVQYIPSQGVNGINNIKPFVPNGITPSHLGDIEEDRDKIVFNDGTNYVLNVHNIPTNHRDSVWSDTMNVLANGQSTLSMATVNTQNDADSVLGEMLGLNIEPKQGTREAVGSMLEVVIDAEQNNPLVMNNDVSGSYQL